MVKLLPLVFAVWLCGAALTGYSQGSCRAALTGKIKDEQHNSITGATVALYPGNKNAVSDVNGNFKIAAICPGVYRIEVRFLGYKTLTQSIAIKQSTAQDFSMEVEETVLNELLVEEEAPVLEGVKSYHSLSDKELERQRSKSLGQLLADGVAGVTALQTGPRIFKPVIHGVHSQRILIINDGMELKGQRWGVDHAPALDASSAHKITVVKDAGALKYGSGSLGGVVVVTPEDLPERGGVGGQVEVGGYSNGLGGRVAGELEGGVAGVEGLGWRVRGALNRGGDARTAEYVLSNTGFSKYTYQASAGFHRNKLGIEASYSSFNAATGILRGSVVGGPADLEIAMERSPPQLTRAFTYAIRNPRQEITHNIVKVNGHYDAKNARYRIQYGLQQNNRKEFDVRRGGLNELPALHLNLATHLLDMEVEYGHKETHYRCTGVNGTAQLNRNVAGTQRIPFIPNYNHYAIGVYHVEYVHLKKTLLEAGLRYDYKWYSVSGRDVLNNLFRRNLRFHGLSGTLGANYFATPRLTLIANVGSAWRPLNMAELYSRGTRQSVAAIEYGLLLDRETAAISASDGSDINNEHAIKWVGTVNYKDKKWTAEVSAYVNYIFNYTYLRPEGVTRTVRGVYPYSRYTQTDASFIGVDISGQYALTPLLTLDAQASWLRATDEENDDYLIAMPANRFSVGGRYEKKKSPERIGWSAGFQARYVMRQHRAPRVITVRQINESYEQGNDITSEGGNFDFAPAPNGYFLAELQGEISVPIKTQRLIAQLSIENLFNALYKEYTDRMRYYAHEMGINVELTLRYKF